MKTDSELVYDVIAGEPNAFAMLVERHLNSVHAFAYRYMHDQEDADDVTQEAFVRAWKNIKKFDTTRNFKTWLFTITRNVALDVIKKKKPLAFLRIGDGDGDLESFLAPYVTGEEAPDASFERTVLTAEMRGAMDSLPPGYRTVLAMRYNENLKFREIAEKLDEPIDTVKSKHRRGLILLRKLFRDTPPSSLLV